MKTLLTISFAGLMFVATGLANDGGAEDRFMAKWGRYTPAEEARLNAAESNLAAREETTVSLAPRNDNGAESRFSMKWGRYTPAEEARLKAAVVAAATGAPAGRYTPAEEARLKALSR